MVLEPALTSGVVLSGNNTTLMFGLTDKTKNEEYMNDLMCVKRLTWSIKWTQHVCQNLTL